MTVLHIKYHTRPYTRIDNACLEDERLTFKARGILAYLLTKPEEWEVRVHQLAKASPEGIYAIRSAMKELIDHGYAQLIAIHGEDGKLIGKQYSVSEGIDATEIPQL